MTAEIQQPHFGKRVLAMMSLLEAKSKQRMVRSDRVMNALYDYLYEHFVESVACYLTTSDDAESCEFLCLVIEHEDDILLDRLDFLGERYQWYGEIVTGLSVVQSIGKPGKPSS